MLKVTVAKVNETLFEGDAKHLIVPGSDGAMTILANHEPIISTLKGGTVSVQTNDGTDHTFDINSGILEASGTHAVVLV